jgi:predicted ATPase
VVQTSESTQIIIVTHSAPLTAALDEAGCHSIALEKKFGETTVIGADKLREPAWHWPSR